MSRRPVDKRKRRRGKTHGQDAIWAEIRRLKKFTITDLCAVVDMHRKSINNSVNRLVLGGIVARAQDFDKSFQYVLIKDTGKDTPRFNKDGQPVIQGSGNENMWRCMRMMPSFTVTDLVAHSTTGTTSVKITTAKAYVTMLQKAGYLRLLKKADPFRKRFALYRLVKNTGPRPPQIQKISQVFDPNIGKVTYRPEDAS